MAALVATDPVALSGDTPPRSTSKNFRSILIGRLFSALSIWLALVALTKMADPAVVGLYALAQALCIPIAEVAKMSLREIRSSDVNGALKFGDYMGMRLLATLIGFVLMVAAGSIQTETAAALAVVILYGLARCCELVSDMVYGLFQAHERMEYIGRSLCILGPFSLLMLVVGYWLTKSLAVAVTGQLLAHLAVLFLHDLRQGRMRAALVGDDFTPRWQGRALIDLTHRSTPLIIASLLIIVALFYPRVAVEHQLGLTGLGLFAAILALAMAPDRLVNALGVAASVRLAVYYADGQIRPYLGLLGRLTVGVGAGGSAVLAICILAGEDILRIVYTDAYAREVQLLIWLVAASALRSIANVLRYGVIATRQFWWIGMQNGVAAVVAVAGCALLIPEFGLPGAGATMVLVFAAQLLVAVLALFQTLKRFPSMEGGA